MQWARDFVSGRIVDADRRVARQTLWSGCTTVIQVTGALVQVAISARLLGPERYGVLAVIVAASSLVYGLLSAPGGNTIIAFTTRSLANDRPDEAANIVRFTVLSSVLLAVVAYCSLAVVAVTAHDMVGIGLTDTTSWVIYATVGVCLSLQSESVAIMRLADRLSLVLVVAIAGTLTRVAFLGAAWMSDGSLIHVVLAYLAGAIVEGGCMLGFATACAPRAGVVGLFSSWSARVPRDLLRFHGGMFGSVALGSLNRHLDALIVVHLAGAYNVGLYRAARQVVESSRQPLTAFSNAIQVDYARLWHSNRGEELRRLATRYTLVGLVLSITIFVPLVAFQEPVVRLLLGDEFAQATPLVLILVVGGWLAAVSSPLSGLCVATGRTWGVIAPMLLGIGAGVIALVWLVPMWGAEGAAWARNVHYLVAVPVSLMFAVSILRRCSRR